MSTTTTPSTPSAGIASGVDHLGAVRAELQENPGLLDGTIGAGANHAKDHAVAAIAEKMAFSRPNSVQVLGLGVSLPQGRQHGVIHVITPSPIRLSNQQVSGCQSHHGATMATANSTTTPTSGTPTSPDHTSLSFVRIEHKGKRNQRLTSWFAVPDETYGSGNVRGHKVASELMAWVQSRPATYATGMIVREVMAAAFAVLAETCTPGKSDRRGAAVTFLDAMAGFVMFAATHANHQAHLAGQAQRSEDWAKESAQLDAERNRQTGLRLAALRKAKREAKAMEAGVASELDMEVHHGI